MGPVELPGGGYYQTRILKFRQLAAQVRLAGQSGEGNGPCEVLVLALRRDEGKWLMHNKMKDEPCEGDGCTLQMTAGDWKLRAEPAKHAAEILPRFSFKIFAENWLQSGSLFSLHGPAEICHGIAEILPRFAVILATSAGREF